MALTPALRPGHRLELLQGGAAYFPALVAAIDAAVHDVRLETYIYRFDDPSGRRVTQALIDAAARGVTVRLVVDGIGTGELPPEWAARLDAAGVQWRVFSPLGWSGLLNPSRWRRLHRKLCVVDGEVAFCGGINVIDDLEDPGHGHLDAPRFDFAVRVTGPLVEDVHDTVEQLWWRFSAARRARRRDFPGAWRAVREAVAAATARPGAESPPGEVARAPGADAAQARAALLLRDNLRNRRRIERAYHKAIGTARREVVIANAYFLPGYRLRRALLQARQRGVRVLLLLQGRYEYFMQFHAARPVYGTLLAAGVEIHEYAASFLHAKVAVIDGHWATVGSSNLDPLSLLLAREANVEIDDAPFAGELRDRLLQALAEGGRRVDMDTHAGRSLGQRLLDWVAYGLMRLALVITGNRY